MMKLQVKEGLVGQGDKIGMRHKTPPNGGRWSDHEHRLFLQGIEMYGKDWRRIARLVQTRTTVQTRSHAQKHFDRLEKERREEPIAAERTRSTARSKPPPSSRKETTSKKRASIEVNVMFPTQLPTMASPPLLQNEEGSFLDDHIFRCLNASTIPIRPIRQEELDLVFPTDALDYFSFTTDIEHDSTNDNAPATKLEYLLEDMANPPAEFYESILEESKGLPSLRFAELTPRSHTPDQSTSIFEPSISPLRQRKAEAKWDGIKLDDTIQNDVYM